MRYLLRSFAAGALRRGKGIEQLLSGFEEEGRRGIRYACIWPANRHRGFVVRVHVVEEVAGLPVDEFGAFYEDEYGDGAETVGETESAEEAITLAERELGADPGRWVNEGVLGDEYHDFAARGRRLGRWEPV
ncbi:hypothetical protein [Spirillospora sp. NPDC048819]|uniref:hypothetical protein n=1 Tax=Spirillospora sp. NPDC048819 TaxID=3155268 RepID=UPI0033FC37A7